MVGERERWRWGRRDVRRRKGRVWSSQKVKEFDKKERVWRRGRRMEEKEGRGGGERMMMERDEEKDATNTRKRGRVTVVIPRRVCATRPRRVHTAVRGMTLL